MGRIKLLNDSLIGKIAAGEVVERPVSALKELIENSLDAGASAVTAEIREGGTSYLRVTDNGCGIEESDIRLAFERHATSKISREPDLFSIRTLGFRGEALASIAAVSHVVMTTRTEERETGLRITNEGGRILKIEETACTTGTTIVVTDLFFNTPVRKGFMKKPSTEAGAVHDVMVQFILSRPDVSFRYISDGKTLLHSPGDGRLSSAAMTVFGANAMKSMRQVEGHGNGILLKGYVGIGENARGNRGQEYFFINQRMMHSNVLSAAVETACRERVMIGKFPVCALHLKIAYESVDVNVHPNKLEVRFRDEKAVGDAVLSLVLEALKERPFENPVEMKLSAEKKSDLRPGPSSAEIREGLKKQTGSVTVTQVLPPVEVPSDVNHAAPLRESGADLKPFRRPDTQGTAPVKAESKPIPKEPENRPEADRTSVPAGSAAAKTEPAPVGNDYPEKAEQVNTILPDIPIPMKVFGALFNTFILIEYDNQLLLVDQHAVHERLLFDKLMREHADQRAGQELLVPLIISLSEREMMMMDENRELFESIGLIMERFGEHDAAVRTVPVILGETANEAFVRDIIAEAERAQPLSMEKKRTELLQTACKHAVKGGEALTEDEIRSLLKEMIEKKVVPTCPHGRPLVVSVSHREIDKKFKRIQD